MIRVVSRRAGITGTTVTAVIVGSDERRARRARGAAGEGRLTAMAGGSLVGKGTVARERVAGSVLPRVLV